MKNQAGSEAAPNWKPSGQVGLEQHNQWPCSNKRIQRYPIFFLGCKDYIPYPPFLQIHQAAAENNTTASPNYSG